MGIYKNVWECIGIYQDVWEGIRIYWNVMECNGIYWNVFVLKLHRSNTMQKCVDAYLKNWPSYGHYSSTQKMADGWISAVYSSKLFWCLNNNHYFYNSLYNR